MSVCCAFAEDSYQESKPGYEKRKSEQAVVIARQNIVVTVTFTDQKKVAYNCSDPGGTLKKIKALFSRNEEHCISKEVKGNALALKDKSCRPETTITAE